MTGMSKCHSVSSLSTLLVRSVAGASSACASMQPARRCARCPVCTASTASASTTGCSARSSAPPVSSRSNSRSICPSGHSTTRRRPATPPSSRPVHPARLLPPRLSRRTTPSQCRLRDLQPTAASSSCSSIELLVCFVVYL